MPSTRPDRAAAPARESPYLAGPGQALGYKLRELKIKELRARAERELGAKFDIRAFHDQILGAGPGTVVDVETRIHTWIGEGRR